MASVVGLSHLFRNAADSNGAKLKMLAAFLGKSCKNADGRLEVVLRRNPNVAADGNAVSILVSNPHGIYEGGKSHIVGFESFTSCITRMVFFLLCIKSPHILYLLIY